MGGSHGSWNGRGAIKTPVWAHATTANPTPPGPWEGAKPKGGGGSLDSEQRHTPRAAHVPLAMCGGLLVGAEVQGADSALATRTCPGRRSEPWWEGDKASGMLRCLITGASAGSRAWSSAAPAGQASPPPSHTPHDHLEGGATWVLARADGSSAVASLGTTRATF